MRQSQLFTKTRKEAPTDEVSKNAQLLIRGGYIYKEMAGVYAFLPLGLRVFDRIIKVIREEMNAIDGQEILMTALQNPKVWETTNRWSRDVVDNWFTTNLKDGAELGLAFTHEEPITNMMKEHIQSFRDLPRSVYQFQTKFRNEARAKSGIMRGREFVMKDLYSFSRDTTEHETYYERAKQAYVRIFERLGLGAQTYITFASGGTFCKYSHEFQTLTDAGEDLIYVDEVKHIAVNKEVYTDEVLKDLGLTKETLVEKKAVEVGNIFSLGTKFSDAFDLTYLDEKGEKQKVIMGSYGIGPGRAMGTIVEVLASEKGIVWPKEISPYQVHLIVLGKMGDDVMREAEVLYDALKKDGVDVLYDDREQTAGVKFSDADLLGIPLRLIISGKSIEKGGVEFQDRTTNTVEIVPQAELLKKLARA